MTIALVHGGGFTAASWNRLLPFLPADTLAIDLPGRGRRSGIDLATVTPEDCAQAVVEDLAGLDDVVLVGHSLAGVTVPRVMQLIPQQLRHVVLVSAIIPAHGDTVMTRMAPATRAAVVPTLANGIYSPKDGAGIEQLTNDLDDEQTTFVINSRCDDAARLLTAPNDLTGFSQETPRTYVRLTNDQRVPPSLQDECIALSSTASSPCRVVEIDAGHMVMVSRPDELAQVLLAI